MKFVAGFLLFIGFAGLLVQGAEWYSTTPYDNGETATGVVLNRGPYLVEIIYTDTNGTVQTAELDGDFSVAVGTELEVSYRPDQPGTVRAPELRDFSLDKVVFFAFLAVMSLLLWHNPWTKNRLDKKLSGAMLSKSDVLTNALRSNFDELDMADLDFAFPVVRRRPLEEALRPILVVGAVALVAFLLLPSETFDNVFWALYITALPVALFMAARHKQLGVVLVSQTELKLVELPKGKFAGARELASIPRTTPLPPIRVMRHSLLGGPLPFPAGKGQDGSRHHWFYAGNTVTAAYKKTHLNVVRRLIAEQRPGENGPRFLDAA